MKQSTKWISIDPLPEPKHSSSRRMDNRPEPQAIPLTLRANAGPADPAKSAQASGLRISRRRHPRVCVRRRARFVTKDSKTARKAELGDLSAGGAFIRTDAPPPPGTDVACGFVLDDLLSGERGVAIRAAGKVIWVSDDPRCGKGRGFGLKFEKISMEERNAVARAVDILRVVDDLEVIDEERRNREALIPGSWADSTLVRVEDSPDIEADEAEDVGKKPMPEIDVKSLPPISCWGPRVSDAEDASSGVASGDIVVSRDLPSATIAWREEQRQSPRASIRQPVRVVTQKNRAPVTAELYDLSTGGMFVRINVPPPPGTVVACGFHLDGDANHPDRATIIAKGVVVWTSLDADSNKGCGFGLKFEKISDENLQRIAQIVRPGVSTPPAIECCVDERRYVRISVQKPVRIYTRDSAIIAEAKSLDLSVGGMFIRTDALIPCGTIIDCTLDFGPISDSPDETMIFVRGKVVWTSRSGEDGKGRGIGMKFIEITAKHLQRIARVVHARQGRRTSTLLGW